MSEVNNFMLFGLSGDDSRAAARRIDALFGISMLESSNDSYFWYGDDDVKIELEYNQTEDEDGKYFHRARFAEFPLLMEVYNVADQDASERAILGDPQLKATRLVRTVYRDGPAGEVTRESYGPAGEVTIERFLHGVRITDESD